MSSFTAWLTPIPRSRRSASTALAVSSSNSTVVRTSQLYTHVRDISHACAPQRRELGAPQPTPLWFYILKEAELSTAGASLAPVGGRIVGEVLLGC